MQCVCQSGGTLPGIKLSTRYCAVVWLMHWSLCPWRRAYCVQSYGTVCAGSGLTPWCMKGDAGCSAVGSREQVFCGRVLSVCVIIIIIVHLMLLLTFAAAHCTLLIWITLWFPSDQCCSTVQVFSYRWVLCITACSQVTIQPSCPSCGWVQVVWLKQVLYSVP